jgi:hypothetical protein
MMHRERRIHILANRDAAGDPFVERRPRLVDHNIRINVEQRIASRVMLVENRKHEVRLDVGQMSRGFEAEESNDATLRHLVLGISGVRSRRLRPRRQITPVTGPDRSPKTMGVKRVRQGSQAEVVIALA